MEVVSGALDKVAEKALAGVKGDGGCQTDERVHREQKTLLFVGLQPEHCQPQVHAALK